MENVNWDIGAAHFALEMGVLAKVIDAGPVFHNDYFTQRDCVTCLTRLSALLSCNLAPFGELIKVMLRILLHPSVSFPFPLRNCSCIDVSDISSTRFPSETHLPQVATRNCH